MPEATKSIWEACLRLNSGSTATFAPIRPAFSFGLTLFSAATVFRSDPKEGIDV